MSDFLQKCEEFYLTRDFYEILHIKRDATQRDIKKAYHKLSLLIHPDRVEESKKAEATEKFKVLGKIHSILQDADKRAVYDESGEFDEESDSGFNWMDYWRSMFKGISISDIQNYEKTYIGSEEELADLKSAYVRSKGDMDVILELMPFSNCDSEPRFIQIVRNLVEKGEVKEYERFFNEPEKKKKKRRTFYENEKKLYQDSQLSDQDFEREIQLNNARRVKEFEEMISRIEATSKKGSAKRKGGAKRKSSPAAITTSPFKKRATKPKK